ncbi:Prenylated rab acceptor PRA1 [Dillenia turbinata]|uniref:PRA1 family protein n=1 Tax=Dillenia turbinata TaxID=194707 RepID=A0AAN8ZDM4_9MAGN
MSSPYTTAPNSENEGFISRTRDRTRSIISGIQPWSHFINLRSLSLPSSLSEATNRVNTNLLIFQLNYAIISLVILFLSLLYHPISIIVFLIVLIGWISLYFSRDSPLILFGYAVDDRVVAIFLSLFTMIALIWTSVWLNVLVSLIIASFVVILHATIRVLDDDDQESGYTGLLDDRSRGNYNPFG